MSQTKNSSSDTEDAVLDAERIHVFSDQPFTDSTGAAWSIRASLETSDYCCDLYCQLTRRGQGGQETPLNGLTFCNDGAFNRAVLARLKELGYAGPDFGHAEMGMQSETTVTLETTREFAEFAHEKFGWTYAEGMQAWRKKGLRSDFMKSFSAGLRLELQVSDGSVWSTNVSHALRVFLQLKEQECENQPGLIEQVYSDPELRGNLTALKAYLCSRAPTAYPAIRHHLRLQKAASVDLVLQAMLEGALKFCREQYLEVVEEVH